MSKATIAFLRGHVPSLLVDGKEVAWIQAIDLDLGEVGGQPTITIDKLHINAREKTRLPGFDPLGKDPGPIAPWEEGYPDAPVHPCVIHIPPRQRG